MEKQVYSFTNMQPKLKVGHYAYRNLTGDLFGVNHIIDFAASYDRDKKWGGDIDSLFVLFGCTGDDGYVTFCDAKKISDYRPNISGVHIDTFIINVNAGLYDDGDWWYTDLWAWVKDNENMPSDTVHISIGHVEQNLARREYEGR
jgi:hypothetical protein